MKQPFILAGRIAQPVMMIPSLWESAERTSSQRKGNGFSFGRLNASFSAGIVIRSSVICDFLSTDIQIFVYFCI